MTILGKVNTVTRSSAFSFFSRTDNFTRLTGQVNNLDVELWRSSPGVAPALVYRKSAGSAPTVSTVVVTITEAQDENAAPSGDYFAAFTSTLSGVFFTLIVRHADSLGDVSESYEIQTANHSDLLAAVEAISSAQLDVLVDVAGTSRVVAGSAWTPIWRFRERGTLALFDPLDGDGDPGVVSVEVLGADSLDVLQTVGSGDITRLGLGRYSVELDAVASAGTVVLRVTFMLDGDASEHTYNVEVYILNAEVAAAAGGSSDLDRIYTCPSFLEDDGFDLTGLSTRVRWKMIKDCSALVDKLTNQWFNGEKRDWTFNGRGSPLIQHKSKIPIGAVTRIEIIQDRTNNRRVPFPGLTGSGYDGVQSGILDPSKYVVHARAIERVHSHFPDGAENIRVTGVLGWVENPKSISTTSAEDLTAASNSLQLVSVAGITARNVVEIIGAFDSAKVMVTSINRGTSTIYFDPVGELGGDIESGAVVQTFGSVPRSIEKLTNYLFGAALRERTANTHGEQPIDAGRIRRERTDDYEYELFPTTGSGSASTLVTGNLTYENIVREFSIPGGVLYV